MGFGDGIVRRTASNFDTDGRVSQAVGVLNAGLQGYFCPPTEPVEAGNI
jgi:hypothetical protein